MGTKNSELLEKIQQEKDEITIAVIAYKAEQVNIILNSEEYKAASDKQNYVKLEFAKTLASDGGGKVFSPERASALANRYTPLAALDLEGAGHIILEDSYTNSIVIAGRGTENEHNKIRDLVLADAGNIAMGDVPIKQFMLHLNDISRHLAEKGKPAVQFNYYMEQDPTGVYHPRLTKSELPAEGTGVMNGRTVSLISNHSESSVYGSLESDIFDVQNRSINGPGVDKTQMLGIINDARKILGKSHIETQDMGRYQTQRHTTGLSVIDNLWGGLPGEQETITTKGFSHSSVDAMHVREMAEKILIDNPKIESRQALEKVALSMTQNPKQTLEALKIFSENPAITTFERAAEINMYKYHSLNYEGG